jgi:hypothetical protein
MAEQFNHKYSLEFGQPISFYGANADTNFKSVPFSVDYTKDQSKVSTYSDKSTGDNGVRLTSHNMSFSIKKGKDASTDNSITIYNISDSVRKFLEQNNGKKPLIILRAGYESDLTQPLLPVVKDTELPIIFNGEVIQVVDTFDGTTRKTELTCTTGTTAIQEAYSVRSYRAGTKPSEIINDVLKDMKLPVGTYYLPKNMDIGIEKPVAFSNPSIEFLRRYGKDNGYKVWFEDGAVNILSTTERSPVTAVGFKISSGTNMIGSPSVKTADVATTEKKEGNRQNITVTTTLNGAYSIGAKVELDSKYHKGVYEIESISHNGTFEGSDWNSQLELKPVDGWEKQF